MRRPLALLRRPRGDAARASWTAALRGCVAYGRSFGIAGLAAVFMALTGAFGMEGVPLGRRLAYWAAVLSLGTVGALTLRRWVGRSSALEARPWLGGAVVVLALTLPATLGVWAITHLAFGGSAPGPLGLVLPVAVTSAAVMAVNLLAHRRPLETHAPPVAPDPASAPPPPPRFLERLPPKLRGAELFAVEAQDHYLQLHTSRGTDLILLRLADAVAELDGLEGAQTHRSWWVARDGYACARRADSRAVLTLKSGAEAPVSRTYVKALQEEGWF